ncbi:uncharacterized protein EI90DRAFT_1060164 [Cantharellus anzutake]|uniref:uncharacterized protein n=1 Tax=Cantharellus anzutake TaxID=1750568 RepID=UPI001903A7B7|nr:uncharacterized protein EI90DRAFT_1060164 [Cantharellus anzutake]KAF8331091.1 hypothetical protein EI90DRAFT_1060164 [Cantharellus anzutake]
MQEGSRTDGSLRNSNGDRYWMEDEDDMKLDVKGVMSVLASVLVIVGVLFLATVVSNGEYRSLPIPRPPHHSLHPAQLTHLYLATSQETDPISLKLNVELSLRNMLIVRMLVWTSSKKEGMLLTLLLLQTYAVRTYYQPIPTKLIVLTYHVSWHLKRVLFGIGGGGFAIIRIPPSHPLHSRSTSAGNSDTATPGPSEAFTIDFRETAPRFLVKPCIHLVRISPVLVD